jgi:hypothetical protein
VVTIEQVVLDQQDTIVDLTEETVGTLAPLEIPKKKRQHTLDAGAAVSDGSSSSGSDSAGEDLVNWVDINSSLEVVAGNPKFIRFFGRNIIGTNICEYCSDPDNVKLWWEGQLKKAADYAIDLPFSAVSEPTVVKVKRSKHLPVVFKVRFVSRPIAPFVVRCHIVKVPHESSGTASSPIYQSLDTSAAIGRVHANQVVESPSGPSVARIGRALSVSENVPSGFGGSGKAERAAPHMVLFDAFESLIIRSTLGFDLYFHGEKRKARRFDRVVLSQDFPKWHADNMYKIFHERIPLPHAAVFGQAELTFFGTEVQSVFLSVVYPSADLDTMMKKPSADYPVFAQAFHHQDAERVFL